MSDEQAFAAVLHELTRARAKHPNWPIDPIHRAAIVAEECGELAKATVEHVYERGPAEAVTREAIHTAATCLRLLAGG
jgi:hypothetical protein